MSEIKTHKDLDVWKESMNLAKEVYKLTESFPKEEIFGLTSQIRRAAVSIASNIAEGAARNSRKEFIQALHVSLGSLAELETQLLLAKEIGFLQKNPSHLTDHVSLITDLDASIVRTRKMILGLIKHLKRKSL
jgi:four helix bundle protein